MSRDNDDHSSLSDFDVFQAIGLFYPDPEKGCELRRGQTPSHDDPEDTYFGIALAANKPSVRGECLGKASKPCEDERLDISGDLGSQLSQISHAEVTNVPPGRGSITYGLKERIIDTIWPPPSGAQRVRYQCVSDCIAM